uniref:3HCDH domain-containing protein n=1 Tax=Steinernema glaseri TaxID=37863 RepID=A0A1I8A3J6_9BILA
MQMENVPENVRGYLMEAYASAKQWRLPNGKTAPCFKPVPLKEVGVIGGGTMGRGIAIAVARAGYRAILIENDKKLLESAKTELAKAVDREVKMKRLSKTEAEKVHQNLTYSVDLNALKNCDLVIEAIFENMEQKKVLFGKLNKICKKGCILGTNTSSLDIDELASPLSDRSRLVGIHFFNPAHVMKMIEIIAGSFTSGEAVATAFEVSNRMKKLPVLVGNCPGFVFNRILFVYSEIIGELMSLYGFFPKQVDKMMMDFGIAMGPAAMWDMNGIDVGAKVAEAHGWRQTELQKKLMKLGRYGRKTGRGYYVYNKEGRKVVDPEVETMIKELKEAPAKRVQINGEKDALDFVLFPTVNEAFKLIEEGMIADLSQIDLMLVFGMGWPVKTGGLVKYVLDNVGLHKVKARLDEWYSETGLTIFKPSKMLDAFEKKPFKARL